MSTKIPNGSEGCGVGKSLTKREDDKVVTLESAWDGLPTLSAPKDTSLLKSEKISGIHFHYKNPGEGVVVYVVDGYGDLNHDEFRNLRLDGVLSAGAPPFDFLTDIQDAGDHGSVMIDKIAGEHAAEATVAGMLAMYISRDLDSNTRLEDGITKLKTLSWKRNPEGVPIIHNGITPDQWPEEFRKIIS
ncbi:hypothetical protein TWF173_011165 [Orbilia oligospora]|nr:hypothetical protein TWF173_011165 [Orbilia oligospora]